MACIINATVAASAPAPFRIATPETATQDFVGGWEDAIDFVVVSEETVFDSVIIQQGDGEGYWEDTSEVSLTFTDPNWEGTASLVLAGQPLYFRAKGIVDDPPSTEYTAEVVITYTTPTLTITTPTGGFEWTRGDNDFVVHVDSATPLGIEIYDTVSGHVGTLSDLGGGDYGATLGTYDSGSRTFFASLEESSFAGTDTYSAEVTGTVT